MNKTNQPQDKATTKRTMSLAYTQDRKIKREQARSNTATQTENNHSQHRKATARKTKQQHQKNIAPTRANKAYKQRADP